jgi:hypothetical protein
MTVRFVVLALALALVAAACGSDSDDTTTTTTAGGGTDATTTTTTIAATGGLEVTAPDIPESTVRFGMYPCCADQTNYQVAIVNGWYEEVGISLDPSDGHLYATFDQILPSMQRGDFDVAGTFIPGYLQTLDTFGQDLPPIFFNDHYVGYAILAPPESDIKTAQEFVDEGMSFADAAAAAMQQLIGQEVYTPPHGQVQPPYPDVFLSYAGLSYPEDLDLVFLEDVKIVELSTQEGRVDFAIPYAAPVLVQMLRNGWKPVIDTVDVLNDTGSEQATRMGQLVGSSGLFAQRDWVENDHDTVLRFLSVAFRTLDYLNDPATQDDGFKAQADLMNASQGLTLTPDEVGVIWDAIDPMWIYEEQSANLWDDPGVATHIKTGLEFKIQELIDNGTLTGDGNYDLDEFVVAEDLFNELVALQAEADGLFSEAQGMSDLSASQQGLIAEAQVWYDQFNFLDATRWLKAALGK